MIIREETVTGKIVDNIPDARWDRAVFYDIETTGLSWRSSHLYLIGALYCDRGTWKLKQWFLDRPFAEKEMLQEFSLFLEQRKDSFLADYNGDTFDQPYLNRKYAFYKLPVPALLDPDNKDHHTDLLRLLRPLKPLLPVPSLRLQDVEALLETGRKDVSSGKELIEVYYRFLQTGDSELLDSLFLHNHDDVLGLPRVTTLFSYSAFQEGRFSVAGIRDNGSILQIKLTPEMCFPVCFTLNRQVPSGSNVSDSDVYLSAYFISFKDDTALLEVPVWEGECKLFFPDPGNYYYLPKEDRAIHKSVGSFLDPSLREQARAHTCYQRVQGRFFPLPGNKRMPENRELPCFYREYKDTTGWIRVQDLLNGDTAATESCVRSLIKALLSSK